MALIQPPAEVAVERHTGPHLEPINQQVKQSVYTGVKTIYETGAYRWRGTVTIVQQSVRRESDISLWLNRLRGQFNTTRLPLPIKTITAPGTINPALVYTQVVTDEYLQLTYSTDLTDWTIEAKQYLLFADKLYRVVSFAGRVLRVVPNAQTPVSYTHLTLPTICSV